MNVAIVVAGGKGTRFGGKRPKQFLELRGTPIIIHTLGQFERCREIASVVVVLPAEETAGFQSLVEKFGLKKVSRVVAGGETRAQSVANGLAQIETADVVAVHDGVRPLVTPDEIDRVVSTADDKGAAILVANIPDTLKEVVGDRIIETISRANLRRALTPQCFHFDILKRAYLALGDVERSGVDVTDESMLVERLGIRVIAVEGSSRNIKITQEDDLRFAEAFLSSVVSGQ